jgi:two-component system chemotaxis response regulator CheB
MPAHFLTSFAKRLDASCAPRVLLAEGGERPEQGTIYLAPGGATHMALGGRIAPSLQLLPDDESEVYVPSVEVLFKSAQVRARSTIAVLLTGMGRDGAAAMLGLRNAGSHTIAQSGESAVVDGMPKAAREVGAVCEVSHLSDIAGRILSAASSRKNGAAL